MIFFNHPNFPAYAAQLLQVFDETLGGDENSFDIDAYPHGTPDKEWMPQAGKRRPRPFILIWDNDMQKNKVARKMFQESDCNFIMFKGIWRKRPWTELAWRLTKFWPNILKNIEPIETQSLVEVTINGKIYISNL